MYPSHTIKALISNNFLHHVLVGPVILFGYIAEPFKELPRMRNEGTHIPKAVFYMGQRPQFGGVHRGIGTQINPFGASRPVADHSAFDSPCPDKGHDIIGSARSDGRSLRQIKVRRGFRGNLPYAGTQIRKRGKLRSVKIKHTELIIIPIEGNVRRRRKYRYRLRSQLPRKPFLRRQEKRNIVIFIRRVVFYPCRMGKEKRIGLFR